MKKQFFKFLAVGLVAILVLGACSSGGATTVVQDVPAEVTMTDAEMEALISEKIEDEHTLEFIMQQDKTAEEWSETLDRMIQYGAKISPEEKTLIIDWLVNRNK
jgi:ABC-type glycerol-3-phosphate transport system substrate-binding protein